MRLLGPARRPGPVVRGLRRLVDLRLWLKLGLGGGVLLLVLLPMLADLANAALKRVEGADGACRILRVIDGDTVTLMCPGDGMQSARILGYDTPEKFSPQCLAELVAAERASWALRTLIQKAGRLAVVREGVDRYGRLLVRLELDGIDVARAMIRAGHARQYSGRLRGSWC